jgi:uncharacterized membrane protein
LSSTFRRVAACVAAALALTAVAAPAALAGHGNGGRTLRFATFNASVNRNAEGQLVTYLSTGQDPQLPNVAEIHDR